MQINESAAILQAAGTAAIADIFDQLQLQPPVLDNRLFPVLEGGVFAGPAYTVAGEPAIYSGSDRAKLEAIDGMPQGAVALWAGQGVEGVCCFGDLLATAMRARGVVAAVVDGGVRDIRFLRECGMPVFTRYRTPAQGVGRWKVTAREVPVKVRGALCDWLTVAPGDMLVGDADGLIAIPLDLVAQIAAAAAELSHTETSARREIAEGLPLLAALAKYGHL
jgi:4-hydroxy-4-methyl-2-oxoglutarate aldolase